MRKTILALAAMMAFATGINAQEQQERPERPPFNKEEMMKLRVDGMAKDLGLDDAQKTSLQKLFEKYSDMRDFRMPPRRPAGAPNDSMEMKRPPKEEMKRPSEEEMKKMHEEMKKQREEFNAELKKILTSEQYTKYQELEKQRAKRFGDRRGGRKDKH